MAGDFQSPAAPRNSLPSAQMRLTPAIVRPDRATANEAAYRYPSTPGRPFAPRIMLRVSIRSVAQITHPATRIVPNTLGIGVP